MTLVGVLIERLVETYRGMATIRPYRAKSISKNSKLVVTNLQRYLLLKVTRITIVLLLEDTRNY